MLAWLILLKLLELLRMLGKGIGGGGGHVRTLAPSVLSTKGTTATGERGTRRTTTGVPSFSCCGAAALAEEGASVAKDAQGIDPPLINTTGELVASGTAPVEGEEGSVDATAVGLCVPSCDSHSERESGRAGDGRSETEFDSVWSTKGWKGAVLRCIVLVPTSCRRRSGARPQTPTPPSCFSSSGSSSAAAGENYGNSGGGRDAGSSSISWEEISNASGEGLAQHSAEREDGRWDTSVSFPFFVMSVEETSIRPTFLNVAF